MHDIAALIEHALDDHLQRVRAERIQDVINVQFALPYGPIVRRSARKRGVHYVVHLRGDDVWIWPHASPNALQGFRDTVRDASAVFAVSQAVLAESRRLCDEALPQGIVVPNGIDVSRFRPPMPAERARARSEVGLGREDVAVICVATAIARKGWRELLEALEIAVGRRGVLLAASSGAAEMDLASERSRLAPNVRLVARHDIDQDSLVKLYHAADVFCLPSHGEGLSNALLEAMACGLPVVTTPVGGHLEVVTSGVNGEFVPVRDVAALTSVLSRMLADATLRNAEGAAARRSAEVIGTPRDNGAHIGAILDALVHDKSALPVTPHAPPALGAVR
jgi:glycosyltransferase involved in cell wall biosynthesis